MNPFFSIIIPTYNRAYIIKSAIDSILKQTFKNYEIIVVDDGSTDNTETLIRSMNVSKIIYFKTENYERGAARNLGISLASGNYITFLDSDDIFYSNHLSAVMGHITRLNFPKVLHLRYDIKDLKKKESKQSPLLKGNINKQLIYGNFISCHAIFLEQSIAKQNMFNEDRFLAGLEDWELWLRIAPKYKIHYVNQVTSAMIVHDQNSVLTRSKDSLIRSFNALFGHVLNNKEVAWYYSNKINKFKSGCYSYISLHLIMTKEHKKDGLSYLAKAWWHDPTILLKKRFYAILKHFFFHSLQFRFKVFQ